MAEFILRFEAADFDNTVFDTPRLPSIRGASLAYLYSPEVVDRILSSSPGLTSSRIYTGASQGAWLLKGEEAEARKVAGDVRRALGQDDRELGPNSHLSYVVTLVRGGDVKALVAAEALNTVEKRQGMGFPLPALDLRATGYDKRGDRARPALPGDPDGYSAARRARSDFGRRQRQGFYRTYSERRRKIPYAFTDDLTEMVSFPPDVPDSVRGKTAVFYADADGLNGRRTAAIQSDAASASKAGVEPFAYLKAFSEELKSRQQILLDDIIDWLTAGAADARRRDEFLARNNLRFETLMWGGDEVLFVMPAWLGLEFASRFFEWTSGWTVGGRPVAFSAGLVIANHKTPIRQMKRIADDDITAQIKTLKKKGIVRRDRSALQIEIFESLSLPDTGFEGYRQQLYFHDRKPTDTDVERLSAALTIGGDHLGDLCERIATLKSDDERSALPRSQLYAMIRALAPKGIQFVNVAEGDESAETHFERWRSHAGAGSRLTFADLRVLDPNAERKMPALLSLSTIAMLWDYVGSDELVSKGSLDG